VSLSPCRRSRRLLLSLSAGALLAASAGVGCAADGPADAEGGAEEVTVAFVVDGDTIELEDGVRVRLVQIDAPEAEDECYGLEADEILQELVPEAATVRPKRDPALDDTDRFDRLLRYVHVGETNVNLALVERGAASVWFVGGDRGRYADELLDAARSARSEGRSVWGACEAEFDPYHGFQTTNR
jgi:endonuclease YncB( thermonuclease family)